MSRATAISWSCSAVNTVRLSVWDTSITGTELAFTVTVPSVVVASPKSTWAPEETSTVTSRASPPAVTL
jgi:hypothetical protein